MIRTTRDLAPPVLPTLVWGAGHTRASLDATRSWAEELAVDAIRWYLTEKRGKARASRRLRATAISFATLGGAVPVAALAAGRQSLANWGFLLLALAAGCVAYDRLFGYSSSWTRYLTAATTLRAQLVDFQVRWAGELAALGDTEPDEATAARLMEFIREFVGRVSEAVRVETEAWRSEFDNRLHELESGLAARPGPAAPRQPGAA